MARKRIVSFLAVLGLAGSSAAAPITWVFEGQVGGIQDASPTAAAALSSLGVSLGSAFSGQIVFESTTPDSSASPTLGRYFGAISILEVTIGSFHTSGALSSVIVVNADPASGVILMQAQGSGYSGSIFDTPGLELALIYPPLGTPSSDALPLFPA